MHTHTYIYFVSTTKKIFQAKTNKNILASTSLKFPSLWEDSCHVVNNPSSKELMSLAKSHRGPEACQ